MSFEMRSREVTTRFVYRVEDLEDIPSQGYRSSRMMRPETVRFEVRGDGHTSHVKVDGSLRLASGKVSETTTPTRTFFRGEFPAWVREIVDDATAYAAERGWVA